MNDRRQEIGSVLLDQRLKRRRNAREIGDEATRNHDAVLRNADPIHQRLFHDPESRIGEWPEIHGCRRRLRPEGSAWRDEE